MKSCTKLVGDLQGAEVRTIEDIADPEGTLSRVQKVFRDHHGLPCGHCTPGMVMLLISNQN